MLCANPNDLFIKGQWLFNDVNRIVDDALSGIVKCNPGLALLDTGKVIIRREHLLVENVKLLSGGASGHEPSYAGFVGPGMLTAAVQGNIYSSPSTDLVLRTIKELARRHDRGVLIIIGNNMTDRLNFGLAMERALNIKNLKIKMLVVGDSVTEHRGLIGTLLIQKIAGAMAEAHMTLLEIYNFCKSILKDIKSTLVCIKSTYSPYYEIMSCSKCLYPKEMELGAGLHGEPGFLKIDLKPTTETVRLLLEQLSREFDHVTPIVVFINNLGNTSKLEEHIFVNEVITQLQLNRKIAKVYSGTFMTSLEMAGFSITILKVTHPATLQYLEASCGAPYWKFFTDQMLPTDQSIFISTLVPPTELRPKANKGPVVSEKVAFAIQHAIVFACGALISCEKQLNIIDSESGDADTGTNIKRGAVSITASITRDKLKISWPFMLLEELSKILEKTCEGLLCCLYAIMFESAAQSFAGMAENDDVTAEGWLEALNLATNAVKRYGKTTLGNRTMYDSLHAAVTSLKANLNNDMTSLDAFGLATVDAEDVARRTRLNNQVHPDPGAHAVGIWMRAVYEALKLQTWPLDEPMDPPPEVKFE